MAWDSPTFPPIDSDPPRVETTYRAFVDFYDLEPLKDGRYFWFDFTQQRTMAELVADPIASIQQDIQRLCTALSARISQEIDQPLMWKPNVTSRNSCDVALPDGVTSQASTAQFSQQTSDTGSAFCD